MYKHTSDKRENKWTDGSKLEKIENIFLPKYIQNNSAKFKDWID